MDPKVQQRPPTKLHDLLLITNLQVLLCHTIQQLKYAEYSYLINHNSDVIHKIKIPRKLQLLLLIIIIATCKAQSLKDNAYNIIMYNICTNTDGGPAHHHHHHFWLAPLLYTMAFMKI